MKAGGMLVKMANSRITKAASLRLNPNDVVANTPVGMLISIAKSQSAIPPKGHVPGETYGRMQRRQVKYTVKISLYLVWVLNSTGTGLMPFSSTPSSRSFWYHLALSSGREVYTSPDSM